MHRVGAVSLHIEGMHYNLGVKLLNDHFGIQVRGGCACAGTYGHYLLHIDEEQSNEIRQKIYSGDVFSRPGWIRLSLHPTMTLDEAHYVVDAIKQVAENHQELGKEYESVPSKNIFRHKTRHQTFADDFLQKIFYDEQVFA
jgi:selenocysteine lyase/cysteine desulfurase